MPFSINEHPLYHNWRQSQALVLHIYNIYKPMKYIEFFKPILAWLLLLFVIPFFAAFFVVVAAALMFTFELILILKPSFRMRVEKMIDEFFLDSSILKPTKRD